MDIDNRLKRTIAETAFDSTIGCGNDSERVNYVSLERALGRQPTQQEREHFARCWERNLQEMASP